LQLYVFQKSNLHSVLILRGGFIKYCVVSNHGHSQLMYSTEQEACTAVYFHKFHSSQFHERDYCRPSGSLPVSLKMDAVTRLYHFTHCTTQNTTIWTEDTNRTYICESMGGLYFSRHMNRCATRNPTPCSVSFLQPATQIPLLWNSLNVFVLNMQPVFRVAGGCEEGRRVTEKKTNVRRAVIPLS